MMFQPSNPAKEPYPQFSMTPFLFSERNMLQMDETVGSKTQIKAFTIANKADIAISEGKEDKANSMAFHALKIRPDSVDALRVLAYLIFLHGDADTALCALRELLSYARPFCQEAIGRRTGDFYYSIETRPYIRILNLFGQIARSSNRTLLTVQTYEEILRLNKNDNTSARDRLACAYAALLLQGDKRRTAKYLTSMMKCSLSEQYMLFGEDKNEISVRWAKIALQYLSGGNWEDQLKKENKRSGWLVKYLFREISFIPEAEKKGHVANGYVVGSDMDDARKIHEFFDAAALQKPQFIIDMHKVLRNPGTCVDFDAMINEVAKKRIPKYTIEELKTVIDRDLNLGREALSNKQFIKAESLFTSCRNALTNIALLKGSSRFISEDIPFAVLSNRSTASIQLGHWNLARIDIRFLLKIKPDHMNTYEKLPYIAEAFFCQSMKEIFQSIASEVKESTPKTPDEWRATADIAIGLLSIDAMMKSRTEKLSQSQIASYATRGIEDLYTPVNLPKAVYPILPFTREIDLELSVV